MISDFQLVLIGIIAVVIVGVIVYNRWQETIHKKRAEQLFGTERNDALFNPTATSSGGFERREPSFGAFESAEQHALDELTSPILDTSQNDWETPATQPLEPRNLVRGAASELVPVINTEVDTVAMMLADAPVAADLYAPMITQSSGISRNLLWEGLVGGLWQPIDPTLDVAYREIRAGLQLADRGGAIEPSVLAQFDETMAAFAASIGAVSQREGVAEAQRRAQMVDQFLCRNRH